MRKLMLDDILSSNLAGRGVKVALIDSGINPYHPHVNGIAGAVRIGIDKSKCIYCSDTDLFDRIGHGTACAGIICKIAGEVKLYSIKVFDESLSTYTSVLIEAIKWSVENKVSIINMSLGTHNKRYLSGLRDICRRAHNEGIIIVAAGKQGKEAGYPAAFSETIATTSDGNCREGEFFYDETASIKFLASAKPRPLPNIFDTFNFHGDSFSAPYYSGLIALLKEKYPFYGADKIRTLISGGIRYDGD
ncbi:MAG: S8 family serine peptidase [Nitrospinae bacterium]|nr:S8 family serine peptidase [Nitrospinota bacterium]